MVKLYLRMWKFEKKAYKIIIDNIDGERLFKTINLILLLIKVYLPERNSRI